MEKGTDIYRDSWLRYLGYANEVGESFRNIVPPKVVTGSYVLATGYCLADTVDKTFEDYNKNSSMASASLTATDVFIWQMLASVMIPGYTINRLIFFSGKMLQKTKASKSVVKFLPVVIGLSSIPFIVHPIDNFTDYFLDNTYRKFIKRT